MSETHAQEAAPAPKRRGPGRPSKGERHPHMVRFPVKLYERLQADAEAAGYKKGEFSDYVIAACKAALESKGPDSDGHRYAQST
ncbi:hypothetical protein J0910_30155 [Nocardiopsis sp. CNT-189]|uniref:hypothetical protein n=1 Tax=Nocardiopsis oceanisediminis TaxID=2816862 RepID=UPI003B358E0C